MGLGARLADAPSPSMTLLPDGSVDRRFGVLNREQEPVTRDQFAAWLTGGQRSFVTDRRGVEPGGQSVNAAMQARALDADVELYGHLDHDVFGVLDVDRYSMGAPAAVNIYEFEDAAMMLTTESTDIQTWSYADFAAAGGERALDADAVVWLNWASLPNSTAALHRIADEPRDGDVFAVDPGGVGVRTAAERREFVESLSALADRYEVSLSVNDEELQSLAGAVGVTGPITEATHDLRERAGVAAVVMHGEQRAVAATRDAVYDVPNVQTSDVSRFTGGGDRFTSALAFARACGWGWRDALELANAAASYYVATGLTGDRGAIAEYAWDDAGTASATHSPDD
jgi:sugar/nucleoside kinase (ribokinase family)